MSLWRQISRGLRALKGRVEVDDEIDEEVRDYFERARADLVREGLSPDEASRAARRELGDVARAGEELRSYGWENVVEATFADLRYARAGCGRARRFTLSPFSCSRSVSARARRSSAPSRRSCSSRCRTRTRARRDADRSRLATARRSIRHVRDVRRGCRAQPHVRWLAVAQRWNRRSRKWRGRAVDSAIV